MSEHEPEFDAAGDPSEPLEGDETAEDQSRGVVQESLRRVILGGASALLTTEEGLRSLFSERRLPKEALSSLLAQTDKTRRELAGLWGKEIKGALGRMDAGKELRKALNGLRFDVSATVRVVDEKVSVDKSDVRLAPEPAAASSVATPPGSPAPKESPSSDDDPAPRR